MYQAIAFVISAMPMEQAAQTLREFSLDILALVHAAASKQTVASSKEMKDAKAGNLGLQDRTSCRLILHSRQTPLTCCTSERLALRWIQKYISQFGGDPDRVTL